MNRRSIFKKISFGVAGLFGLSKMQAAEIMYTSHGEIVKDQNVPLFSGNRAYGNLIFIAGKGAHFEGDIKAHTKHVLNELKTELEKAGSNMNQVLKVNVYLNDLNDYAAMNEVYKGSFGDVPPVRTTIAAAAGIPGNSLVEIDCIAFIK
ncbi:MAG: RidA family protein [Saprospiraceae bacterium]